MYLATEIDRFGGPLLGLAAVFAFAAYRPDIARPFIHFGPSRLLIEERLCTVETVGPHSKEAGPFSNDTKGTRRMVRSAVAIVRAVASRPATPDEASRAAWIRGPTTSGAIAFDVVEVLKGDSVPNPLIIGGVLTETDDFNTDAVPYVHIRPAGERGPCWAYEYRRAAQFLLVLARDSTGRLSPYYDHIQMPANEQLRGIDDPWLVWVRSQVPTRR
jgi:hypothetical protein